MSASGRRRSNASGLLFCRAAIAEFARRAGFRCKSRDSGEKRENGLHRFYTGIFNMIFSTKINGL
jgi:hypothetical protein